MLDTIQRAIEDIRNGKMVIVVDDEDRENEGDFIVAADQATPEIINFMSKEGRGLICAALPEERCDELGLELMAIVSPDLFDAERELFNDVIDKVDRVGLSMFVVDLECPDALVRLVCLVY